MSRAGGMPGFQEMPPPFEVSVVTGWNARCIRFSRLPVGTELCGDPGLIALRESELDMVRKYVRAAIDAGLLDWLFLAIGILLIGLGVAYADLRAGSGAGEMPDGILRTGVAEDGSLAAGTRPH